MGKDVNSAALFSPPLQSIFVPSLFSTRSSGKVLLLLLLASAAAADLMEWQSVHSTTATVEA